MLALNLKKPGVPYPLMCLGLVYLVIFFVFLPNYLNWNLNLGAGLLLAPYICNVKQGTFSFRYLAPTLLSIILALFIPVKTFFFVAFVFACLLMLENSLGKLSSVSFFLFFLISPVFRYLIGTIDFPIRLWLTAKVAALLQVLGINGVAAGNIIEMDGYSFNVDPACAGLKMLVVSLIICLFMLIHFQKTNHKKLGLPYLIGAFVLTVGLNMVSNFFRIFLLVIFKIMPDAIFHDIVGLLCLVIYLILPLLTALKIIVVKYGKTTKTENIDNLSNSPFTVRQPLLHLSILAALIFIGTNLVNADTLSAANPKIQLNGFKKQVLNTGIIKLENSETLIYVKPAVFYIPSHDPKICWTGSGYTFNQIKKDKIGQTVVYTAKLSKGKDLIYAAWWFDNGNIQTVNQLQWRWNSAQDSSLYYLVNVNTLSKESLHTQVTQLLANRTYLTP